MGGDGNKTYYKLRHHHTLQPSLGIPDAAATRSHRPVVCVHANVIMLHRKERCIRGRILFTCFLLTPNQKDSQLACMRGGRSDVGVPSCLVDKLAATEGQ